MSEPPKEPPKKMDPGWNDPPMLNYTASNPPPKSRITNKRVPFPMTGAPAAATSATPTSDATPSNPPQGPPKN